MAADPRIAPTVAGGEGTADSRWQSGWTGYRDPNLRDLVDAASLVLGSLTQLGSGEWRSWVLRSPASPRGSINVRAKADHQTELSARAWVEAEVRREREREGERDAP